MSVYRKENLRTLGGWTRSVTALGVLVTAACTRSRATEVVPTKVTLLPTASATYSPDQYVATGVARGVAIVHEDETKYAPTPTETSTPTQTPSPSETPLPTAIPTATLSPEEQLVAADKQPITDFLASRNGLADETQEYTQVGLDRFKDYFSTRYQAQERGENVYAVDLMYAQLAQPVKDLKDRKPNFHKRNDGQGLGFTDEDLDNLMDFGSLSDRDEQAPDKIFRPDSDGYKRSWAVGDAKDFDGAVLAFVDGWLASNGIDPQSPLAQGLRQSTFERIIYGDWGVKASDDGDNNWQTILDRWSVCTTFAAYAVSRDKQPERVRFTLFDPQLEKKNEVEQESVFRLDSHDSILISAVIDKDGYLRVEVHTLSNPPDVLHGYLDHINDSIVEAHGARWIPCGVEIFVTATGTPVPIVTLEVPPTQPPPLPGETPNVPETPQPTQEKSGDPHQGDEGSRQDRGQPGDTGDDSTIPDQP